MSEQGTCALIGYAFYQYLLDGDPMVASNVRQLTAAQAKELLRDWRQGWMLICEMKKLGLEYRRAVMMEIQILSGCKGAHIETLPIST